MKNKENKTTNYYIERVGNETNFYEIENEDIAKNCYGISQNEILKLSERQLSRLICEEISKRKNCSFGNLCSLDNIVVAEKRLGSNIRNLQIDEEIETFLEKFSNMTYEEREKIAEETGTGDYEACSIYSEITGYAKEKHISTVTISSVALFSYAVGSYDKSINLLNNLRRTGIHIYFKDDGVWTGKSIHDLDIGALLVLAWCSNDEDE